MQITSKRLIVIVLAAFAPLLGGCGSDCEDLCDKAKSCKDADTALAGADCAKECQQSEDLADAADCSGEFDDVIGCALDNDVCHLQTECQKEALSFAFCGLLYCQAHPSVPECKATTCTIATSSSGMTSCSVSRSCQGEPPLSLVCNEMECTCAKDQATVKTVPTDPAFCSQDTEVAANAAGSACGW